MHPQWYLLRISSVEDMMPDVAQGYMDAKANIHLFLTRGWKPRRNGRTLSPSPVFAKYLTDGSNGGGSARSNSKL